MLSLFFNSNFNQSKIDIEELEKCRGCINKIIFDRDFNQPIDNLPNFIEYLELNGDFLQPLNNLHQGLKQLVLNTYGYNQALNFLPIGLKELTIKSYKYTHPPDNLQSGLEKLKIMVGDYHIPFNVSFNNLPNTLTDYIWK
jgi:hypothetical protein